MARTGADKHDFLLGFVGHSRHYKSQFIDKWVEILSNFVVEPHDSSSSSVARPYGQARGIGSADGRDRLGGSFSANVVLKSGETHKAIMTYAANLVLSVFGDPRGEYIQAEPVGYEDAIKAQTVTKLLRYVYGLPGHFRTHCEAVLDCLLFGTAIVETPWRYVQREMPVRSIQVGLDGVELEDTTRELVTAYDDVSMRVVDNQDFFPDPGESRIADMPGVAKRFRMNGMQARKLAKAGLYSKEAVERAINMSQTMQSQRTGSRQTNEAYDENFREQGDQPRDKDTFGDFLPMIGYEYWGEMPWEDDEGSSRGVITSISGVLVRPNESIAYPLNDPALPFHEYVINPVKGRFYGISPAEVIRYSQDMQDAMMRLLAMAMLRRVMPPVVVDEDSAVDVSAIARWSPDKPIAARGGAKSVSTLKYDSDVFGGFNHIAVLKQEMQETSGALNVIQGQGLGSSRATATQANFQQQQAMGRPELAAAVIEREALPGEARGVLRRYQQFLDTDGLKDRVGEMPEPVWIGDIMGDFDLRFVGSRQAMSRQEKMQGYDRLVAFAGAVPEVRSMMPWIDILQQLVGNVLELPEVAAKIGSQEDVMLNLLLQQASGQAGQAGSPPSQQPNAPAAQLGGFPVA